MSMGAIASPSSDASGETFPWERVCPFQPPKNYELFQQEPITQVTLRDSGLKTWLVTGYHNIRLLLTDPRISASRKHDNFPFYFNAPPEFRTETSFIGYDEPDHGQTRGKAAVTFTNRRSSRRTTSSSTRRSRS